MTSQDESKFIEHWKQARKFDPKSVSDWLELGIKSVVFVGMLAAGARYVLPVVAPDWATLPQNVQNNTATLEVITNQLTSDAPQIVEFRGMIIPGKRTVFAGDTVNPGPPSPRDPPRAGRGKLSTWLGSLAGTLVGTP